jgi:hypothetical protein
MLDIEQLLFTLLVRDQPTGLKWQQNVDVESIDNFPLGTYDYHGFGQDANGDGLWSVILDLNLLLDDPATAFSTVSAVNDSVHLWADNQTGIVPSVGHVQSVKDLSIFSPANDPTIPGRLVMQYAGSFTLGLRNT